MQKTIEKIKVVRALCPVEDFVADVVSAINEGGEAHILDNGRAESTRDKDSHPFVEFQDVNTALLYMISDTKETDEDFIDYIHEFNIELDDEEAALGLLETYCPEAIAVGMYGNNAPFYWVLRN